MTGVFVSGADDDSLETSVVLAVEDTNSQAISSAAFDVLTSTFTSANNDFVISMKGKWIVHLFDLSIIVLYLNHFKTIVCWITPKPSINK